MNTTALSGLRVADVGTDIAASYCARLLADFGADVVKVEDIAHGGDPTRRDGPSITDDDGDSALFVYLNQNKRSVALDTRTGRGREIWRRLVLGSDIVVESGYPGELARHDLTFAQINEVNPKAIVASVTPFGQDGPYRARPACHLTVSALGGWLKSLGEPGRPPIDAGFPALDYVSAVVAAVGAVAAWRATLDGSDGQQVDVSQQEIAIRMQLYPSVSARLGLPTARRTPFPMYVRARDGYAAVNALSAQHWRDACLYMELYEEAEDPALTSDEIARAQAAPALQKRIDAWAADKTREEIFQVGQAMRIPAGIPYTLSEVVQEEHFHQRNFFRPLATHAGVVQQPVGPLGSESVRRDWTDAPRLGEHTAEVLDEWLATDPGGSTS